MTETMTTLVVATALIAMVSLWLSPRVTSNGAFFQGRDDTGTPPSVLALTLSQVTTWIFARSIMNAAILGYFYGIGGALAYAAYYLSFLTGAWIIASLRFKHGFGSVQDFLADRFGLTGTTTYNFVVGVRLLSEVFANLLVIGLVFGSEGTTAYVASILIVGGVALAYALMGGLHAAIRTDVFQMVLMLAALGTLLVMVVMTGSVDAAAVVGSTPDIANPGWVLLVVALLQVWSYPLHDPVMMDRGFIADRRTTLASFYHATWVSLLCILAFGLIGVWAGLNRLEGEAFVATLGRLVGDWPMLVFNVALIVSCMSTLDSTFASTAKLTVIDMRVGKPTLANGRLAMVAFLFGGLLMVFFGSKDLFSAVAVSGTASMFLAPVVFFSLWLGRTDIPVWSYLLAFLTAMTAAALYFTESSGYSDLIAPITGASHKYEKLLILSALTLAIGCAAFAVGMLTSGKARTNQPATGAA